MASQKLPEKLKLGTRGSALALAQTEWVIEKFRRRHPKIAIEKKVIQTSGDTFKGELLAEGGGKGLFVKEIEEALLKGEIDFAVHSLKDLPGILPNDLALACFPKREDARDCLISKKKETLKTIAGGARIGTSSPRRTSQILSLRSDLKTMPIRGNIDTRLKKLEVGEYDAIFLAMAGLNRLALPPHPSIFYNRLEPEEFIPAVGQGVLGIETRAKDGVVIRALQEALEDPHTAVAAKAERIFLAAVGGDCYSPIAAHAQVKGNQLQMVCWIGSTDGKRFIRLQETGDLLKPEMFGETLAKKALSSGGQIILNEIFANKTR